MSGYSNIRIIDLSVEQLEAIIQNKLDSAILNSFNRSESTRKVNIEKLCQLYGWPKATIYGWVFKRYIPHSKVGKVLMFDLEIIEEWINGKRIKTKEEIIENGR